MNPNPKTQRTYTNVDGTRDFAPTGEVRLPRPGEFYVSTRINPGRVSRAGPAAPSGYTTEKVIVAPLDETTTATSYNTDGTVNNGIDATPGALHLDANGNEFEATGEVRLPNAGEFYVSNSTEPGVVHGPLGYGITRRSPKVIVTPVTTEDSDESDSDEAQTNTDLTNQFFEEAMDGRTFFNVEETQEFESTGIVRLPQAGDYYVSNNSAPGMVKGPVTAGDEDSFSTPKLIVTPVSGEASDEDEGETQANTIVDTVDALLDALGVDGGHNTPSGEVRDHPLSRFVRDISYQQSGRATSAVAIVILPGEGASAVLVGNGLSVANPDDKFSRAEGRRISAIRALNNIAQNLG